MLKNVKVKAFIDLFVDDALKEVEMDAKEILLELARIGRTNLTDVMSFNSSGAQFLKSSEDIDPKHAAAIKSVTVKERTIGEIKYDDKGKKISDNSLVLETKVEMHGKVPALVKLGEHKGLWKGDGGDVLVINVEGDLEEALGLLKKLKERKSA